MRLNYKQLGEFISRVDIRNKSLEVETLLGVSVKKIFIPSIANTVGTDFKKYKIVKRNQFTYIADTSRRGDKIGLAMLDSHDKALVSQAYTVFEIIDHEALDPEYLMMWFRRPEFDRYARFKSHGSVREIFDWEEMCETELPIPSIAKQRAIVKEYNTVVNRIKLNEQLNQKLEETAQALYKHWFVDFEFPFDFALGKPNLKGKTYKSSGGKMIWNEELDREMPEGWEVVFLEELIEFKNGKSRPVEKGTYPTFGGNGIIDFVKDYNNENVIAIGRVGAYCGSLYRVQKKCWISDNAIAATSKMGSNMFAYYLLLSLNLNERSEGTGQPLITQGMLNGIRVYIPVGHTIDLFEIIDLKIFKKQNLIENENQALVEIKNLLLSKMSKVELEKNSNKLKQIL